MKIAVFTSNQPRHLSLIKSLASVADELFAIQECSTIWPGQVEDFFRKSPVMQDYFSRVIAAEREVFGGVGFVPANVRTVSMKMGDVSKLEPAVLAAAMKSDVFIVFGASYIRGQRCDALVARRAVNIHMGISPQYRGSSTNFWAMYDRRPEFVGATIHLLSRGLDSGPILFHALPTSAKVDPFRLGMNAVAVAHSSLAQSLSCGELFSLDPVPQDRRLALRYTRNAEFTDAVAEQYLNSLMTPGQIEAILSARGTSSYVRPRINQVALRANPDTRTATSTVGTA